MRIREILSRSTGWIFVVLGGIGGLVCIALIVATWILSSRANDAVENLFDGASTLTTNIGAGVRRASTQIESLQGNLAEGRDRWKGAAGRLSEEVLPIDPEWISAVRSRLESLNEWLALVEALRELAAVLEDSLRSFGILINAEDSAVDKIVAGVKEGRSQIEQATIAVDEIEAAIESIRTDPQKGEVTGKVVKAFDRIDGVLVTLEGHVGAVESGIADLDQSLKDLSKRIRGRIRLAAGIATVFFVWQAAAQICLLIIGWRLRGSVVQEEGPATGVS